MTIVSDSTSFRLQLVSDSPESVFGAGYLRIAALNRKGSRGRRPPILLTFSEPVSDFFLLGTER